VHYSLVAVDFMAEDALHAALSRVAAGAASGRLAPLPLVAHGLASVQAALRQMSQARHVGKVVVRTPGFKAQGPAARSSSSGGRILITGGLGSLGALVSEWLAARQAADVVLLGRSGRGVAPLLGPSSAASGSLTTAAMCDAGTAEDLAALLAAPGWSSAKPVAGVMHAGGVLVDGVLSSQTIASIKAVFGPKIEAAALLVEVLPAQPSAFQVLFSSVASLLGSPGQANYSAANAILDGMASSAQARGVASASMQWGAWSGAGMAANDASTAARVERTGMALLLPESGLAALEAALSISKPVLAAVPFVWDKFMQRFAGGAPPYLLSEFAGAAQPSAAARGGLSAAKRGAAGPGAAAEHRAAVRLQAEEAVQAILGASVSPDEPLMAAGLDSLGAVELKNSLEVRLGVQLPGTLVFDYPTLSALGLYLEGFVPGGTDDDGEASATELMEAAPITTVAGAQGSSAALALVGAASMTAGDAILSLAPCDIISSVPLARWDLEAVTKSGTLPARFGGFLQGADLFDSAAFGLSVGEAELMDPQQRLLLELAHEVRGHCTLTALVSFSRFKMNDPYI
jgi:acyl carrier protein